MGINSTCSNFSCSFGFSVNRLCSVSKVSALTLGTIGIPYSNTDPIATEKTPCENFLSAYFIFLSPNFCLSTLFFSLNVHLVKEIIARDKELNYYIF